MVNHEIIFYEKPLIKGYLESPMTMNLNEITVLEVFGTFEFGRDEVKSTHCYMYGVNTGSMYRYTFEVNLEAKTVDLREVLTEPYGEFDGKHYKSLVTKNYFIVSCSDCGLPQVALFDHQIKKVKSFEMGQSTNDPINLAAYEESDRMMQLFVATRSQIDSIIMQENTN